MTENQLTSKLLTALRKKGKVCFKINDLSTAGIPDAYIAPNTWIEAKKEGNIPTPLQRQTLINLARTGASVWVVTYLKNKAVRLEWVNSVGVHRYGHCDVSVARLMEIIAPQPLEQG